MGSIYKISKFFMIITGLWKLPFTDNATLHKLYNIYSVAIHLAFAMWSFSLMIRLFELMAEGAKSEKLFGCLTLVIIFLMILYKIVVYQKTGIPYLFARIIEQEDKYLNSDDEDIRNTYLSQAFYFKWTTTTQMICTFFTVSVYTVSNIYKKITHSFKPGEVFMYEIWVPFDKTTYDMLICAMNIIMVTLGFCNNVAVAAAPQSLMVFVGAQLRILQIRIRKVFLSKELDATEINFRVKELIQNHQDIIEFTTELDEGIKIVILIQYILDSLNVAVSFLHIITIEFSGEMIFSMFHFLLLFVQIFVLAWTAQEINTQSFNISDAVYENSWMDQSEPIKKTMQIIIMRAQKPLAINIGPFRPMNVQASLITLKGAYSYTSLMIQKYT